ncbi:MAG: twin-arginine translocase subunit TatC [Alphaproteobacteria bacterium]|nr:twin-arginine translocase subunit TatC [Alphaproteobacteria bacterium]MBL0717848.1 twin-arginine translocase subunit TatC [Alphaproteobacteria bacterium]
MNNIKMSLSSHISELKHRLVIVIIFAILSFIGGYLFSSDILTIFISNSPTDFIYANITEGFITSLTISLFVSAVLTLPIFMYQMAKFILPALKSSGYSIYKWLLSSYILFIIGSLLSYYILLPLVLSFLTGFNSNIDITLLPSVYHYIKIALKFMIVFGLVFQLPLYILILGKLGIIDRQFLRRHRRTAIIVGIIAGALLSPPDVISQLLIGGTIYLLYEISLYLVPERKTTEEI